MAYPFLWKPTHINVVLPSQVTVFDSNGSLALFETGISISSTGTIAFSLVNYGMYTVKVRDGLALEMATFTTKHSVISTPDFLMYETANAVSEVFFSDEITKADLRNANSGARILLDALYGGSGTGGGTGLPAGGAPFQIVRKNEDGDDYEWVSLTKSLVGLPSVDNTPDIAKPISEATAIALSSKAPNNHTHTSTNISDATAVGRSILTAANAEAVKTILGAASSYAELPAGSNVIVSKTGNTWPPRPTSRTDIVVTWVGPTPDPPYVGVTPPAVTGMYENDFRMVTEV